VDRPKLDIMKLQDLENASAVLEVAGKAIESKAEKHV
jgi:hypothetical protein